MNNRQLSAVLIGLIAAIAVGFVALLFRLPSPVPVEKRVTDVAAETAAGTLKSSSGTPAPARKAEEAVDLKGAHATFAGQPGTSTARWPRFRGERFDNICTEPVPLLEQWPESGPPVLWSITLSEGHGGPAVWDGSVYLTDYLEAEERDAVRSFSLADGREIWRHSYRSPTKRNHGVSRTVPAVNDRYVVSIGPRCHVVGLDRATGRFRWGIDLVRDHGAEVPLWYTGQCPLLDGDVAVLAPAGRSLMMGVDCTSGRILWETPNPDGWKMSHSSIMPLTLLGHRTYVYCSLGGIVGVSAEPATRGQVLWKTSAWTHSVLAPSPVAVDDHRLFLTSGYGGGSLMLGLRRDGDQIVAEPLHRLDKTVFSCEQQTPVFHQGLLYGILTKDAGPARAQFACLNPDGKIVWSSGMTERFGLGPFLFADGKVLILNDTGELTLGRVSAAGYEKLARARVLKGRDAWAPMALVEGRLLLRDSEHLLCLDLRRTGHAEVTRISP